jgi:hypothetical protein
MSEIYQSLSHSKWDCRYHVAGGGKAIFGQTRRHLGQILCGIAWQEKCLILGGHLMPDQYRHPGQTPGGFGDRVSKREECDRDCSVNPTYRAPFVLYARWWRCS